MTAGPPCFGRGGDLVYSGCDSAGLRIMAQERVRRRLAAVLALDVVGYSRLMGADEAGTLAALVDVRMKIVEPTVSEHHGRIVKLMGDGALIEFAGWICPLK